MNSVITRMLLEDYIKHLDDTFKQINWFDDKESRIVVSYSDDYGSDQITITPLELISFIYSKMS